MDTCHSCLMWNLSQWQMKFASASLAVLMTSMRYTTSVSKAAPSRFLNPNPAPKVFVFAHLLVDIHHVMAARPDWVFAASPRWVVLSQQKVRKSNDADSMNTKSPGFFLLAISHWSISPLTHAPIGQCWTHEAHAEVIYSKAFDLERNALWHRLVNVKGKALLSNELKLFSNWM